MDSKNNKIKNFNPSSIGNKNNNIFGLPFNSTDADVVIIPVPWDATTSFKQGASKAPKEIYEASFQVDLYNDYNKNTWKAGISMEKISEYWKQKNKKLSGASLKYTDYLSGNSAEFDDETAKTILNSINSASLSLNKWVKDQSDFFLNKNKYVVVLGGDHSVPLGLIQALAEKNNDFAVLQIDAHADLRNAYEGFEFSHASVMYNVLKIPPVSKLVQLGIRD